MQIYSGQAEGRASLHVQRPFNPHSAACVPTTRRGPENFHKGIKLIEFQ